MVPKYDKFKEWLKKGAGAGLHEHRGTLNPVHAKHRQNSGICSHCALQREGFFER